MDQIKYALIVGEELNNQFQVYHACGYLNKPTDADYIQLRIELKEDDTFNLADRIDDLEIREASQEVLEQIRETLKPDCKSE